jgi:two-component system cell cycle sensor histidine kinase/response regulator CckA
MGVYRLLGSRLGADPGVSSTIAAAGSAVKRPSFSWWVTFALAVTFVVVIVLGIVTYHNTTVLVNTDQLVAHTYRVLEAAEAVLTALTEAENGERGYLITGDEEYLKPFYSGSDLVKTKLADLRGMEPDNAAQSQLLDRLESLAAQRLAQLQEIITLRREVGDDEGFKQAREKVLTKRGQAVMAEIRHVFSEIQQNQKTLLTAREAETVRRSTVTHNSIIIGHCLVLALLLVAAAVMYSDRRRRGEAEAQLAGSQERLSGIVDSAMDGIISIDDQQRIVLMNPAAQEIFGWQGEPLIGQPIDRLVPPRLRDAVARHIRQFADSPLRHQRIGDGGRVVGLRRDNTEFPIEAAVYKTLAGGRQLLTIMLRDVSEREASKRQIREQSAVLDQVRDAVQVRDLEDTIVYWNRGAERLYGWTAEEAIGRSGSELMSPTGLIESEEPRLVTLERESWVGELAQRTKSGREILVEQRRTLIHDELGAPAAQLIIAIDVTERRRAEAQKRRSQRLESIGTLAGGIAHDLNNVLTPILMGAKLLGRGQLTGKQDEIAKTIEAAAERGAEMVKQLLAFAGGDEGRRETVQLGQVINETTGILKHTLPKSIEVRVESGDDLWPITGDATELSQLLLNLSINARDAMPEGGRLTISAENVDVDPHRVLLNPDLTVGPHLLVTVADNGTGIPRDIIDKVFDPFFTTKQRGKGTGLGLASCLGIVRSHGGAINVYSEPGQGTVFTVYLPAHRSGQVTVADQQPGQLPEGRGELVLLVDDETPVLKVAGATLQSHGYRVVTACDGMEALEICRHRRGDIRTVILDMMMPGLDGQAAIQALRQVDPDVRIIASSGLRRRARGAPLPEGTRAFLPKPYSDSQLLVTLRQVLDAPDDASAPTPPAEGAVHDKT